MNRATIIYLALAVLLAHVLAIHKTAEGAFAPPYEVAHVSYRLGRNLAHQNTASWNPGEGIEDSYPSLPWVGLAWAAEVLRLGPNRVAQVVGVLFALSTVGLLAAFTGSRLAGLTATGLMSASGVVAAAAGSGTEFTAAMFFVTATVFAFERGLRLALPACAVALAIIRPEGIFFLAVLLLFDQFSRPGDGGEHSRRRGLLLGVGAWVALGIVRWSWSGTFLSPYWREMLAWHPERSRLGLEYVASFFTASGSALLIVLPVVLALLGKWSALGRRALILFAAWTLLIAWSGGNNQPFWLAFVPGIPMLFLAVQSSVKTLIDARAQTSPAVWILLITGALASFLVSKVPGNLGPLRLQHPQALWMEPSERLAQDYPHPLGRPGLLLETKQTERLRCLGVFLRDRTLENVTVHTLWPGAIGYLSRRRVVDILGRAWPVPGTSHTQPWSGAPKVDLVAGLVEEPDYLVLFIDAFADGARPIDFLRATLDRYDIHGGTPERLVQMLEVLMRYELVCVPVPETSQNLAEPAPFPFPILRARRLGLTPRLEWRVDGDRASLLCWHTGHELVVDLRIHRSGGSRENGYFAPNGGVRPGLRHARTDLLLFESGDRAIELFSMPVPAAGETLTASLFSPGAGRDTTLVALGDEVVLAH